MTPAAPPIPPELHEYRFLTAYPSPRFEGDVRPMRSATHLADTAHLMNRGMGIALVLKAEGDGGFRPWLIAFGKSVRAGWTAFMARVRKNAEPEREPKPSEAHWKTRCVGCNGELPPGKAGRKCATCRTTGISNASPAPLVLPPD